MMVSEGLDDRIAGLYKSGMDIDRIVDEVHVARRIVVMALFRAGLGHHPDQHGYMSPRMRRDTEAPIGVLIPGRRPVPEFTPESVERDYLNGLLPTEMALKYNVPRREVMKLLAPLMNRQRNDARREAGARKRRL